jgi:hypothetical protein
MSKYRYVTSSARRYISFELGWAAVCAFGVRDGGQGVGDCVGERGGLVTSSFTLEKSCSSIWEGTESAGPQSDRTPEALTAARTVGRGNCSPLMGPSSKQRASIRSLLSAARKVAVFQWPCGTLSIDVSLSVLSHGGGPYSSVQVSSMKTRTKGQPASGAASSAADGGSRQAGPARARRASFLSFTPEMAPNAAPHRGVGLHPAFRREAIAQAQKCNVGLVTADGFEKLPMRPQHYSAGFAGPLAKARSTAERTLPVQAVELLPGVERIAGVLDLPGDPVDQAASFERLAQSLAVIGPVGEIALFVARIRTSPRRLPCTLGRACG